MRASLVLGAVLIVALAGCTDTGDTPGDARTYYESLDLTTPEAAVETMTNAFARDDFMTVWLVLSPASQLAVQQHLNLLSYEALLRVEAGGDLQAEIGAAMSLDTIEAIDPWFQFDRIMLLADRNEAFLIDLSGDVTVGEATDGTLHAEVEGIDDPVAFDLTRLASGRWRVDRVGLAGSDPELVPWSVAR